MSLNESVIEIFYTKTMQTISSRKKLCDWYCLLIVVLIKRAFADYTYVGTSIQGRVNIPM